MAQYASTTINSATPGPALGAWLGGQLVDNGWELVSANTTSLPMQQATGTLVDCATSSANATTITRSGGVNWTSSQIVGGYVHITSGTGSGTTTAITQNSSTAITVASWSVQPDATSVFNVCWPWGAVYKSPAASNTLGIDYYLSMHTYPTNFGNGQTAIFFNLFETWNDTTKKARKYVPTSGTGITVDATDKTVTDATGVYVGSTTLKNISLVITTSTNRTFVSDVTVDRLVFGCTNLAGLNAYVGAAEMSVYGTTLDPATLVISNFGGASGSSSQYGGFTREVGAPAVHQYNFMAQILDPSQPYCRAYAYALNSTVFGGLPVSAVASQQDAVRGQWVAAPIMIATSRTNPATNRAVLGGVMTAYQGGAVGDTLAVTMAGGGTQNYVLVQTNSSYQAHVFVRTS